MRAALERLPLAPNSAQDFMDNDGVTDEPLPVVVTIRVAEDGVTVDLTGSAAQRASPINATTR